MNIPKTWRHDPNGGDILDQIKKAPDDVKHYAAMHLLGQGIKPRHIRKKLNMSDRQFRMAERLFLFNQKYDPVHIPTEIVRPEIV
jgi:hypothetical protein